MFKLQPLEFVTAFLLALVLGFIITYSRFANLKSLFGPLYKTASDKFRPKPSTLSLTLGGLKLQGSKLVGAWGLDAALGAPKNKWWFPKVRGTFSGSL